MKPTEIEMKVDNVGSMTKTGAKCVLKGEKEVDGYIAKFSLSVTCEEFVTLDEMDIGEEDLLIKMVLDEPAQKTLGAYEEGEVEE